MACAMCISDAVVGSVPVRNGGTADEKIKYDFFQATLSRTFR